MRHSPESVVIEVYRNHEVRFDKETGKFTVDEIATIEPSDSLQAARNAIDRHLAELNKGIRRKILAFEDVTYYDNKKPRTIIKGELTSWSRRRGYSGIEGVCMFGKDRRNLGPGEIFEDTPENRELMGTIIELDKQVIKARLDIKRILEKELRRAELPDHLKGKG